MPSKYKNILNQNIKRGMIGVIVKNEERINCLVNKINYHGKRIIVFDVQKQKEIEFSLRRNGDIIKVGEPTSKNSSRLIFPFLIRKELLRLR